SMSALPRFILSNKKRALRASAAALVTASKAVFMNEYTNLTHLSTLTKMMNPQNILNKGFAIVKVQDQIVSQSGRIEVGSEVQIQMATEELTAKITSKKTL
ncbi:MAG: xseA, partial [Pedobacter sp.]|nr:xseA [Pedobacter sp.]